MHNVKMLDDKFENIMKINHWAKEADWKEKTQKYAYGSNSVFVFWRLYVI